MNWHFYFISILFLAGLMANSAQGGSGKTPALPHSFYAMDTCTKRPYPVNDISPAAQLDMLKELGYAGVAWTEEDPKQVKEAATLAEKRSLKMFAIYCSATVSADGLKYAPRLKKIMEVLKGHDTIIWLHLGGKGPAFSSLKGTEPVVKELQALAEFAATNNLKIAVYPHVGEWTERVQNAVQLAKVVNRKNFGVTFNLCHCLAMGDEEKIPALLEEAAPYLFTVTINGADAKVKGPQWNKLIQKLDQGSYDVKIVLRKLRELNFKGPIGLQGYGVAGDRRANLAASLQAWKKLSQAVAGER